MPALQTKRLRVETGMRPAPQDERTRREVADSWIVRTWGAAVLRPYARGQKYRLNDVLFVGAGFGAVAAAVGGYAAEGEAEDPGSEALGSDEEFTVGGDDGFAFAAGDGSEDFAHGFAGGHD